METFIEFSIGIAAALGVVAGGMLIGLDSVVRSSAPAPAPKRTPRWHRA